MEGGSGGCQLPSVFPPGTPAWPQGFGKARQGQGEDEQVTGLAIAAAPILSVRAPESSVRMVVGHSCPSLCQTAKHSWQMMWQKAPSVPSHIYLEKLGLSQQGQTS